MRIIIRVLSTIRGKKEEKKNSKRGESRLKRWFNPTDNNNDNYYR